MNLQNFFLENIYIIEVIVFLVGSLSILFLRNVCKKQKEKIEKLKDKLSRVEMELKDEEKSNERLSSVMKDILCVCCELEDLNNMNVIIRKRWIILTKHIIWDQKYLEEMDKLNLWMSIVKDRIDELKSKNK